MLGASSENMITLLHGASSLKKISQKQKDRNRRSKIRRERFNSRRKYYRKAGRLRRKVQRGHTLKSVYIRSPSRLDLDVSSDEDRSNSLAFIRALHNDWKPERRQQLVVDLRSCEYISISAALVLVAELDILRLRHPQRITGIDPGPGAARQTLLAVGFHQYLRYLPPEGARTKDVVGNMTVQLRTGGLEETGEKLPEAAIAIAEILRSCYDEDDVNARQESINRAINEGLLNIRQHAYNSTNPGAEKSDAPQNERRWWALGIVMKSTNTLALVVYDRGVGIPNTLKPNVREFGRRLIQGRSKDEASLLAALQYGRTSRQDESGEKLSGGNGLPAILELISHYQGSQIIVESGGARYIKYNNSAHADAELCEAVEPPLDGTLVVWMLQLDGKDLLENDD